MKKSLQFLGLLIAILCFSIPASMAQNAIVGSGFSTGWGGGSCPTGNSNFNYLSAGVGTSYILTTTANGIGDQYWRMAIDWSGVTGQYNANGGAPDEAVTKNLTYTLNSTCTTSGAFYYNVGNTSYNYIFKTKDAGTNPSDKFVFFEVQGAVQTVSSVSQSPVSASVFPGEAVTVTANLSGAFATGQGVYLRYTNNGYSTSGVVQMTGSGTTYTASIPATINSPSGNVSYYVFTSGDSGPAADGSDADLYTINLNNNSGSNYGYTVGSGWTTTTSGGNWGTAGTWTANAVPPTGQTMGAVTIAGPTTLNQDAIVSSLTINSGKTFTSSDASARTLTISNNTTGTTLANSGTWANGTGASTVVFSGTATHTISGTVGFNNLTTNSTLNPGTGSTVNGTLMLNSGGSVATNPVAYGTTATLYYNEGGGSGAKINTTVDEWPNTGAVNIYIDNNSWIEMASGKSITGNLYVNSGALQSTGGNTLTMNKSGNDTITVKNGNATPGAIFGTDNGSGNDLTLTVASTSTTVFTGDAETSTDDNKKFFNINVNGTLRLQTGIVCNYGTFFVGSTGILEIDGSGYIQSDNTTNGSNSGTAPTYSSGSLLKYNSNTTYGRGLEWSSTSGAGYPYNVELSGSTGTTLDLGANSGAAVARQCAGNLTIDAGSNMNLATSSMTANLTVLGNVTINGTLTLSTSSGGNIQVGGNWYRNGSTGTFTPNNRAVFFIGSSNQYITVTGGGTETFAYLREVITTSGKNLKPNNNLPDTTNIDINGSPGDALDLTGAGGFDINGRTVNIDHNVNPTVCSCSSPEVWIYVDQARTVTDSAGLGSGEFKFKSSANPNQPTWYTSSVHNNSGTGSLTFDNTVLVSIADGAIDFGSSSGAAITTIQGVLQIKLGGSVGQSFASCNYASGSVLRFANDVDYQVPSNDKTWAAGSSGAGVPNNIEVNDAGTNLTLDAPRSITGNITITNGTLTLTPSSGNAFDIGGNWSRTGSSSSFVNNAGAKVVFNGTASQTISCTANSNTETFQAVEIANTAGSGSNSVTLSGSTILVVSDSLILTSGLLATGSNQVQIPDTCVIKASSGNSNYSSSWINGNMKFYFTDGHTSSFYPTATWVFPIGNASYGCPAIVNNHSLAGISSFTATFGSLGSGNNTQLDAYETGLPGTYHTFYTSINNAGSWKIEPNTAPTSGTYDMNLYFTGFTGLVDNQFGLLKRPVSSTTFADFKPYGGTLNATGGAGRTLAAGFALRMGLATFSEFAIGQAGTVLPITMVSFTGENDGAVNALAWTTASEMNTDHFSIERSNDANVFNEIGTVKAAGFSEDNLNYNFTDDNPISGINYYRLGTVDQDGQVSYSNIIAIGVGIQAANSVIVYPNPVIGDISFDVNMPSSAPVNYTLTDVLGRVVQTGQLNASAGINHFQLPGAALIHGVYFLNVSGVERGLFKTTRVIKAE